MCVLGFGKLEFCRWVPEGPNSSNKQKRRWTAIGQRTCRLYNLLIEIKGGSTKTAKKKKK